MHTGHPCGSGRPCAAWNVVELCKARIIAYSKSVHASCCWTRYLTSTLGQIRLLPAGSSQKKKNSWLQRHRCITSKLKERAWRKWGTLTRLCVASTLKKRERERERLEGWTRKQQLQALSCLRPQQGRALRLNPAQNEPWSVLAHVSQAYSGSLGSGYLKSFVLLKYIWSWKSGWVLSERVLMAVVATAMPKQTARAIPRAWVRHNQTPAFTPTVVPGPGGRVFKLSWWHMILV